MQSSRFKFDLGKKKKQHSPTSSLAQDEELWEKVGVWFCSAEVRAGEVVTGLKSLHYLAWGRNWSPLDFPYAAVPENDCSCSWLSAGISPEKGAETLRHSPVHTNLCSTDQKTLK